MSLRRRCVVGFVLAVAAIGPAAGVLARPDLNVTFIERLPRYPAYEVRIIDGLPHVLQPGGDAILDPGDWDGVKRAPEPGDDVTFVAHVVNHGAQPSGPFTFSWRIDGAEVETGRAESLAGPALAGSVGPWEIAGSKFSEAMLRPGTFTNLTFSWTWRPGPYTVELSVASEEGIEEICTENNRIEDRTDALALAFLVRKRTYNAFASVPGPLGSASFEDWVQHHIRLLRARFRDSVHDSAPQGVAEDVRVDLIKVLDDNEMRTIEAHQAHAAGFDACLVFGNELDARRDAPGSHAALLIALQLQLGLVDPGAWGLSARANAVLDEYGELAAIGHASTAWDPLRTDVKAALDEHTVLALNRLRGMRRGYTGAYLYDIPARNSLRVLDEQGDPVPEARVTAYRRQGDLIPNHISFAGQADGDGFVEISNADAPRHLTAVGTELRPNPFGLVDPARNDALLLLKVEARGQVEWHWLGIAEFNLAFWRGHASEAIHTLRTSIPALGAPEPPAGVTVDAVSADRGAHVWLRWQPAEPPVPRYAIARGWSDDYVFETVAEVAGTSLAFGEEFPGGMPRPIARYRVASVDAAGRRSAQTPPAAAALFDEAAGLAALPDGHLIVCDRGKAAPLLLSRSGAPIRSFVEESARLFAADAATGPDGIVAILDMPDASNAFGRVGFILADQGGTVLSAYSTSVGEQPDDLRDPRGIAVDEMGRVYVVDKGNHRVQVFSAECVPVGSLGELGSREDQLLWPEHAAVYQGEIAVADTGNRRVALYDERAPGDFRQSFEIGELGAPCYVAYDAEGTLHVCDRDARRILTFDEEGRFLGAYTGDMDHGRFGEPVGLAFLPGNRVAVADRAQGRVRVVPIDRLLPADTR